MQPEPEPQPPTDLRKPTFVAEKPAAAPERDILSSRSYYQFLYYQGEEFKDELESDGLADIDTYWG